MEPPDRYLSHEWKSVNTPPLKKRKRRWKLKIAPGPNSWVSSSKGSTSQMLQESQPEQGLKRGHWIKRLGWDPWHYYECFQWSGEDKRENEWKVRALVQQTLIKCLLDFRLSQPRPAGNKDSCIHGACVPALFTECPSKNILEGSGRTRDWPVFVSGKVESRELFPTGWWGWSLWLNQER